MDITGIVSDKLVQWAEVAIASLPNLLAAVAIVAVFAMLARLAARLTSRVVSRTSQTEVIVRLTAAMSRVAVLAAGFLIALGVLGLQKTVLSLLAGVGVVGLALGFAFQDMAANLMAGIAMGLRRPFDIGDVVETRNVKGTVQEIALRTTSIRTASGQLVMIPNRQVFENPLTNYTRLGMRRVELAVGVSYDTDLDRAIDVARGAIEPLPYLVADRPVEVLATSFGASSIDLSIRYWIPDTGDVSYTTAFHDGVLAVKAAFDDAGIDIPFPMRTLDLAPTTRSAFAALADRGEAIAA